MYAEAMSFPSNGEIYALRDEKGNTIGTGTRQVCGFLLFMITKPAAAATSGSVCAPQRPNVRAAIEI